jgi:hypothetical protein
MAGRTLNKYLRIYVDGYALCGYSRSIGPLQWEYDTPELTTICDNGKGYLPAVPTVSPGTLNVVMETDSDTTAAHGVMSSQNDDRVVLVAVGDRAAPVAGNPVFGGEFLQLGYTAEDDGGAVVANIPFGPYEAASLIDYDNPWGILVHAEAAADSDGFDSDSFIDCGGSTAKGGYMIYHILAGDGTATITIEHSTTTNDSDAAAVGGLTTGELDCSSVQTGIASTTATNTTINQYVRPQISMNTASTVTFVLGLIRGR